MATFYGLVRMVAQKHGWSESKVSRVKNGHIKDEEVKQALRDCKALMKAARSK